MIRSPLIAALLLIAACADDPAPAPAKGFVDVAEQAGIRFEMAFLPDEQGEKFRINLYDHGAGVSVGDYDGDGDDDLYFLNQLGSNALYRNNGDGTFTDVTRRAGPLSLPDRICTAAAFADIDNDGDQDLFVASTRGGNVLYRNDGTGNFADVTEDAGVAWVGHSQGVAFFDGDADGDLDLFVTNTAQWTTTYNSKSRYYAGAADLFKLVLSPVETNLYYRNDGTGKFTEGTAEAGLAGVGWGGDIAIFDYDEDGDSDVFVSNMFGRSQLYRNNGKGRFTDVTRTALGRTPWGTVGARAFDYDNDGHLDLYLVDMHSDMWAPHDYDPSLIEPNRRYARFFGKLAEDPGFEMWREKQFAESIDIRYDETFFGNGLFRNLGNETFEETSASAHAETYWPWGIAAGDFDNDGDIDAFLPSGMGYPYYYWPHALLINQGDGKFVDGAAAAGIDPPQGGKALGQIAGRDAYRSGRSAAVLDFDGDGRLDLALNNFNDRPNLFANRWPQRAYIAFRLEGTKSNRDAIGAIVRLHRGERVMVRQVQAAGGYLAQSSNTLHFGLGDDTPIDRCEIRWPSGQKQVIENPAPNRLHRIKDPTE